MLKESMLPDKFDTLEDKMKEFQKIFKSEQKRYKDSSKVLIKELKEIINYVVKDMDPVRYLFFKIFNA